MPSPTPTAPPTALPVAADEGDVLNDFDLDDAWGDTAREAFREVVTVRPNLDGSELVSLEMACALINTATRLEALALAADFTAVGAVGQPVLHFAVAEARQARQSAAGIMHRLVRVASGPAMTNSQRGRHAAQALWSGRA